MKKGRGTVQTHHYSIKHNSSTSSTMCYGCQILFLEGVNHGPPNPERVGPLPELTSSSVVASQVQSIPPEHQLLQFLSENRGLLHLFSHVHEGQYQPPFQNQSVQNVLVDVNPRNLEKHTISSTSILQTSQDQTGGSQGPLLAPQESDGKMFIKQQMQHNQQIGHFSMTASEPPIAQRLQEMSSAQQCLPNQPLPVPGNCARRLIQYMHQMHLNANASIEFWRKVVTEFFAPNGKKRWCFSLCKNRPKQTALFAPRTWQCQVCKQKPGCGYEVTAEMLPALSTISYETGIQKELLYVDMPSDQYQTMSGEIVVHYDKAMVELVYQNMRIVHCGNLCIVFAPDLKICSWDFCIRSIEKFISSKTLVPQVEKLQFLSRKYHSCVSENASSYLKSVELKRCSDELAEATSKFQNALNLPPVTDVGFTRRYLRSIEMSEVFSLMGDLLEHSLATGMSPKTSLALLGGLSSQDKVPNSNRKRKRPLVQLEDNYTVAPNGGRTYACSSSRILSSKSSVAARESAGQVDFTQFFAASTPSSSWSDTESSSSR